MAAASRKKPKKPKTPKKRKKPETKRKLSRAWVTVAQAAPLVGMTTGGIYGAIKSGELKCSKVTGTMMVKREDVRAYRREMDRQIAEEDRIRRGDLTDAELMQRMIDNDPDDWYA